MELQEFLKSLGYKVSIEKIDEKPKEEAPPKDKEEDLAVNDTADDVVVETPVDDAPPQPTPEPIEVNLLNHPDIEISGDYKVNTDGSIEGDNFDIELQLDDGINIKSFTYAIVCEQNMVENKARNILSLGDKPHKFIRYDLRDRKGRAWVGDGDSFKGAGDFSKSNYSAMNCVHKVVSNEKEIVFLTNGRVIKRHEHHTDNTGYTNLFSIKGFSGKIYFIGFLRGGDFIDLASIYNVSHQSVTSRHGDNLLSWGSDILDKVASYTENDFEVDNLPFKPVGVADWWDWSGFSIFAPDLSKHPDIVTAEAKHFLYDTVWGDKKLFKANGQGTTAPIAAFLASTNVESNPYYGQLNLMRRALTQVGVDMILTEQQQFNSPQYFDTFPYFIFGAGYAWSYVVREAKLMGFDTKPYEEGIKFFIDKLSAYQENMVVDDQLNNMNCKAIAGMAIATTFIKDPNTLDKISKTIKRMLSKYYDPAGYIDEGDSPETTYNGHSLYYLAMAYSYLSGNLAVKRELNSVLKEMVEFRNIQVFSNPDGVYIGASGYAGRTGGSFPDYDQGDSLNRELLLASITDDAGAWLQNNRYGVSKNRIPSDEAELTHSYNRSVSLLNTRGLEAKNPNATPESWGDANGFNNRTQWPAEVPFGSPITWGYASSIQKNGFPIDKEDFSFARGSFYSKKQDGIFSFWEKLSDAGKYTPWLGGGFQGVWKKSVGTFILARHDKAGNEASKNENTRLFEEIDVWACNHIWGEDKEGNLFSTAVEKSYNVSIDGEVESDFGKVQAYLNTQYNSQNARIEGAYSTANLSIPLFVKDNKRQGEVTFLVEALVNNEWVILQLNNPFIQTEKVRVKKFYGYAYLTFDEVVEVRLNRPWVQSYQGETIHQNLIINMTNNEEVSYTIS